MLILPSMGNIYTDSSNGEVTNCAFIALFFPAFTFLYHFVHILHVFIPQYFHHWRSTLQRPIWNHQRTFAGDADERSLEMDDTTDASLAPNSWQDAGFSAGS